MPRATHFALDLFASATVLIGAVWVYEISNWVSLAVQGYNPSISIAGLLPTGVVTISSFAPSPLTKGLQVAIASSLLLPAMFGLSRAKFVVAHAFAVATVGVFLASFYWEMLSFLTYVPLPFHEAIFLAATGATAIPLLMLSGNRVPRPPVGDLGREIISKQRAV